MMSNWYAYMEYWLFITWIIDQLLIMIIGQPHLHGSLNVPIEHHPTIRYMVY